MLGTLSEPRLIYPWVWTVDNMCIHTVGGTERCRKHGHLGTINLVLDLVVRVRQVAEKSERLLLKGFEVDESFFF